MSECRVGKGLAREETGSRARFVVPGVSYEVYQLAIAW